MGYSDGCAAGNDNSVFSGVSLWIANSSCRQIAGKAGIGTGRNDRLRGSTGQVNQ